VLAVDALTVRFDGQEALHEASLEVGDGEVVTILGPSGCGKTTLLRVIAGLQAPDAGRVVMEGRDLAGVPPHRRGIGLVFQDHALFPHRDVLGNVAFGLRMRGDPPAAIEARVRELLALVGLSGLERRSVGSLSGGEQQRVALARALAPAPRVLLLDEPLGSLDRRLRDRLLDDLGRLFAELAATAIYVTHDRTEAFTLGDRVAVMGEGRIVQVATPDALWAHPRDADVARFLGIPNVDAEKAIRPEAVTVLPATATNRPGNAMVESAVRTGPTVELVLTLDDGTRLEAVVAALEHAAAGERVYVEVDPEGIVRLR
jgi:thiamine transport system ATP-binding protein